MTIPMQKKEREWHDPPMNPQPVNLRGLFNKKYICISLIVNTILGIIVVLTDPASSSATPSDILVLGIFIFVYSIAISPIIQYIIKIALGVE